MKPILLSFCAALLFAQNVGLIPLTDAESTRLRTLDTEAQRLEKISTDAFKNSLAARDKFCAALGEIKAARKLRETHGACGGSGWSSEIYSTSTTSATTGTVSTGVCMNACLGTWEVDKTMKFLVKK